jgi:hypothetical protein
MDIVQRNKKYLEGIAPITKRRDHIFNHAWGDYEEVDVYTDCDGNQYTLEQLAELARIHSIYQKYNLLGE